MSKSSIAIIGANGTLAGPILQSLLSPIFSDKVQFPVKVLTRTKKESTSTIQYIEINWDDIDSVAESLKGTDVIIELVKAIPELFSKVEQIVKTVRPKLFIPSQFGTDVDSVSDVFKSVFAPKANHSKAIRANGIKTVDVLTGFFAEPGSFLYEIVGHIGIDAKNKKVKYLGSPDNKLSYSRFPDIGDSVASLATSDPAKLPDTVRIRSGDIPVKEIVSRYEKAHDVKLEVSYSTTEDALKEAKELVPNDPTLSHFSFYLNTVLAEGQGKGAWFDGDENEIVNPSEKLWKWRKY